MKTLQIFALTILICVLTPVALRAQEDGYEIRLTLIPDPVAKAVQIVGFVTDEDIEDCTEPSLPQWIQVSQPLEADVPCTFLIKQSGELITTDSGYSLKLPELTINAESKIIFGVPGTDLLVDETKPTPTRYTDRPWLWEIDGEFEGIEVATTKWKTEATLTLNPLFGNLPESLGIDVIIDGKLSLTGIDDDITYDLIMNRPTISANGWMYDIDEILTQQLVYPAFINEAFPALRDFHNTYGVSGVQPTFIRATVVQHQAPRPQEVKGEVYFNLIGIHNEKTSSELCPRQSNPLDAAKVISDNSITLCMTIGPQDSFTLQIPDARIISTSVPPNSQPALDTLVYDSPGRFELIIEYEPTLAMYTRQLPFLLRNILSPIENINIDASSVIVTAVILFVWAGTVIIRYLSWNILNPNGKGGLLTLILDVLIVIINAFFLFHLPSQNSLFLLCIYWLVPTIHLRQNLRQASAIGLIILLIIAENIFLMSQTAFIDNPQTISSLMIFVITIVALWVFVPIDFSQGTDNRRITAYSLFFFLLATYDAIDGSILALILLIAFHLFLHGTKFRPFYQNNGDSQQSASTDSLYVRHFRNVWGEPLILGVALLTGYVLIVVNSPLHTSMLLTIISIVGSALLFSILYDFLTPSGTQIPGYIRALILMIMLMTIYLSGKGTSTVDLEIGGSVTEVAVFINSQLTLIVNRIVFYLSIPLIVGLYIEYKEKQIDTEQATPQSFIRYLLEFRSSLTVIGTILSILAPTIYNWVNQQASLSTIVTVLELIAKGSQ